MSAGIVLTVVLAVCAVLAVFQKEQTGEARFDERQERARGTAYKYGFCALGVSVWIFSQLYQAAPWIGVEAGAFLCIDLGLTVFAVTAIWKDAYLRLHERPGRAAAGLALCGAAGLCVGLLRLREEGPLTDGALNLGAALAVISVSDLLVLAVFLYRSRCGGREEEE